VTKIRLPSALIAYESRLSQSVPPWLVLLVLPLACFAVYTHFPPARPLLSNDSPEYMYFSINRPIGYPFVLYAIKQLTGNYESIRSIQLAIFCLSAYTMALVWSSYLGKFLLPLILEVGTLGYPGPVVLHSTIGSDCLSASIWMLFTAGLLHFWQSPSLTRYIIVCAVSAVAITLRPVNISMALSAALLPLVLRRSRGVPLLQCAGAIFLSTLIGWGVTPTVNVVLHGSARTASPLAAALFTTVMFIDPGGEPAPRECDSDFIEKVTVPVARYMKTVPPELASLIRLNYSVHIRYVSVIPGLVRLHNFSSPSQADPILMCYTLARAAQFPGTVFWGALENYWQLISNHTFIDRDTRKRYLDFIERHPPVVLPSFSYPQEIYQTRQRALAEVQGAQNGIGDETAEQFINWAPVDFPPPPARSFTLVVGLKIVQVAAVAVSLLLILGLLPALLGLIRDRDLVLLGLCSLAVQLNLLIVASSEIAIPRYVFPVWPILWLILIWSLWKAFQIVVKPLKAPRAARA
jgi:hypothetical protein